MLTKEDLNNDALYDALVHSGIDPEDPAFLAHYGVEGMRWGVRKENPISYMNITDPNTGKKSKIVYDPTKVQLSRNSDGSVAINGTNKKAIASVRRQLNAAKAHPDHTVARETLKKSLATVSNKDLKDTNTRLALEKQYSQLKYERSTVGKGKNYVGLILGLIGTGLTVATTYTKLATPENQVILKQGFNFINKKVPKLIKTQIKNPQILKRAANVARLATKVVK